jgi:radical SAM protein with 4Fe4S-binding SPASM domain
LPTEQYLNMMAKAIRETGASHIAITGGEPLLHRDALSIIRTACQLVGSVQLVTNGSHLSPIVIQTLADCRLRSVQLTLLSHQADKHNRLKGHTCFDDVLQAIVSLQKFKISVQVCFVATAQNWGDFASVIELCFALGVKAITYNRMSPAGWAIEQIAELMPSVAQVEHNLATAERLGRRWDIRISTAMPIPPCLIRIERYPWVRFGFCSVGTHSPNITIDPLGYVRSCNLSSHIMGNIIEQSWSEIWRNPYVRQFKRVIPKLCKGCYYAQNCQGGCKESAYATYRDLAHTEPFVHTNIMHRAKFHDS